MPDPGKTMIPIGSASSIASLRLNGAAFLCAGPIRFEGDLWNFAVVRPTSGDSLRALRAGSVKQDHVRVLRANLVERVPDPTMIIAIGPASEGDPRSGRQKHLRLGQLLGVEEVPAVDHRRRQGAVIDLRTGARTPGGAGLGRVELGQMVAEEFEGVATLD